MVSIRYLNPNFENVKEKKMPIYFFLSLYNSISNKNNEEDTKFLLQSRLGSLANRGSHSKFRSIQNFEGLFTVPA